MAAEFADTLSMLDRAAEPTQIWRAGFHFNSAIMRLALVDRLTKSQTIAAEIRRSVNNLKHKADAHISGERPVTFEQAVKAAEHLCGILMATAR